MYSYVIYGLQSDRQQHMLLFACLSTSMIVRHALNSTLVVKSCGRSKVCGLYIKLSVHKLVAALMQRANLWYSLHDRCIQQDTLNMISWPDSE